jgi:hypothetical protein
MPTRSVTTSLSLCTLFMATTIAGPSRAEVPLPYVYTTTLGMECVAAHGQADQLAPSVEGAANASTTSSLQLYCPVAVTQGYGNEFGAWALSGGSVYYVDHASSEPFSCQLFVVSPTNDQFWAANRYTCGEWGGCADNSDAAYEGPGMLWWAIPFPYPFNGGRIGYSCTLPPSAESPSLVASYESYQERAGW